MTKSADEIITGLAWSPTAIYTASDMGVVREIMLRTGGRLLAQSRNWEIVAKHLGGGVYRITLEEI